MFWANPYGQPQGYGAGFFSIEQLKEYTDPIKDRRSSFESQLAQVKQRTEDIQTSNLPESIELEEFTKLVASNFRNLNFERKRAIVIDTVEKVVTTQEKLLVSWLYSSKSKCLIPL